MEKRKLVWTVAAAAVATLIIGCWEEPEPAAKSSPKMQIFSGTSSNMAGDLPAEESQIEQVAIDDLDPTLGNPQRISGTLATLEASRFQLQGPDGHALWLDCAALPNPDLQRLPLGQTIEVEVSYDAAHGHWRADMIEWPNNRVVLGWPAEG